MPLSPQDIILMFPPHAREAIEILYVAGVLLTGLIAMLLVERIVSRLERQIKDLKDGRE